MEEECSLELFIKPEISITSIENIIRDDTKGLHHRHWHNTSSCEYQICLGGANETVLAKSACLCGIPHSTLQEQLSHAQIGHRS